MAMNKFQAIAIAATIYFIPSSVTAECLSETEPTLVFQATRYERVVSSLNRAFLKAGKDYCKAFNNENDVKTKPLVISSDTAIDLQASQFELYYQGTVAGRICCFRKLVS